MMEVAAMKLEEHPTVRRLAHRTEGVDDEPRAEAPLDGA
jgi:hypothetical protein